MSLVGRIDDWGRVAPGHPAHVSGEQRLTYGELVRRSDALAARLARLLPDQSPVVVLGHKEPEMLVGFLACAKAGHAYVPVDSVLPRQRVEQILAGAGAALTLTPEVVREWSQTGDAAPPRSRQPDELVYVMFTSGSTGVPKGVPITVGNLTSFLEGFLTEQRIGQEDVVLDQVTFSFDVSVMALYPSLLHGGTLAAVSREEVTDPRRLFLALADSGLTVWISTPSFAQMCLSERRFARTMLPRLRRFVFCGETLPPEVAAELLERFPGAEVWNTYGPTETTVAVTSIRVDRELLARYSPLPIGRALRGVLVAVVDAEGRRLPAGQSGEIVVAGPTVSPGYLGRPDLTQRVFFELEGARAYRTGDRGVVRDDLFFFEGRIDAQVKLHGYRIEPGDIEAHLCALPGVRAAVVVPVLKEGRTDALRAYVVLSRREPESDFRIATRLKALLAERLPEYMIPGRFTFLDCLPLTPQGKADRRRLEAAGASVLADAAPAR